MPPVFFDAGVAVQHPLERAFNASGWEILSAIEKGFRTQVDVKGKLAELFLYRKLEALRDSGVIMDLQWNDKDGVPDFRLKHQGNVCRLECKNVRSPVKQKQVKAAARGGPRGRRRHGGSRFRTRNQLTGGPARGYKADEFEILAACLFNQTGKWEYLFISSQDLLRRVAHPDYLVIMQPVPFVAGGCWKAAIEEVLVGRNAAMKKNADMGKPFQETPLGKAYLADSLQFLPSLPDASVNLVITSPPYALYFKKEYGNADQGEYVEWILPFAEQIKRVLRNDGSFVLDIGGAWTPGLPNGARFTISRS